MVAFTFNAAQHKPQYGGGGGGLPPGKYKGVIVDSRLENVEKNGQITGGYMALDLTPVEGPLVGQKQTDRLNLHNTNRQTVEIAEKQLSAYCHVLGVFNFVDTQQLHNKPFLFEIGFQKGHEPSPEKPNGGYTEVKKIADINGNEPGKAGTGNPVNQQPQQQAIPDAAPAGVQAQSGGWGAGGAAQPQQQQQQPPVQQQQTGGGAWGAGGGTPIDTGVAMPQQQQQQPPAQQQGGGMASGWTPSGAAGGAPASWGQK